MNTLFKILGILLPSLMIACTQQRTDSFILRGTIPGAIDSTCVLLSYYGKLYKKIAIGYVINEKFELRGELPHPTLCDLNIDNLISEKKDVNNRESLKPRKIDFFVENGELDFQTPHIDSLPSPYSEYDARKEKNYTLKGSPSQDIYYQYQQQSSFLRYSINQLKKKNLRSPDKNVYKALNKKQLQLQKNIQQFMLNHQNLYVNLHLVEWLKKSPFTYDQAYLDSLGQLFASYQDTCSALQNLRLYLQDARKFVQGKAIEESEISTPDNKSLPLLVQLNRNGFTLIDFWASWCGPCRASFPHMRDMHKQYGDQVKFISISLDQKEEDWQKALKEESLPWPQFLASKNLQNAIQELYAITGIPTFLLVNAEGEIIFSGHDPNELEYQLEKL